MGYLEEYYKLKNKRNKKSYIGETNLDVKGDEEQFQSFMAEYRANKAVSEDDITPLDLVSAAKATGIVITKKGSKKRAEEDTRTWFQQGAYEDGYQQGDFLKTASSTIGDAIGDALTGVIGMGEKVVDAGAYILGGIGGVLGADKFQNNMQSLIQKDLYDEAAIANKIVKGELEQASKNNPLKMFGTVPETDEIEELSVLGEKSDALVQSAGQLAGTAALQGVGVPWWVTTGATSFGAETENALNQGATYGEAGGSALISAGAEILTEKLSGGIKFGGITLDDVLLKPLTEKISNKVLRTLINVGIDAVGEGAEEVISSVFSNLGTSLYKEESIEELLTSEEAMDEYLESFIGGAVLGGAVSSGRAVNTLKQGRDYKTGLTENEQKVIDKEVENRISELETDEKKLTNKEKAAIEEKVKSDLAKGYISTDTIESVLGGDTYNAYKENLDSENALKKEYEELGKLTNPTLAQQTRYSELREQIKALETDSKSKQLKEQLSKKVSELVKSDMLVESYNENARRRQAFEADLTKYDAKMQETVKRAVESGILNNTNRTHDFVDMIAKISADKGVLFDFTNNEALRKSGFAVANATVNGFVTDNNVTLNIDSAKSLNSVVGHEITHVLEGTDLYTELQQAVMNYATTKGDYDARLKSLSQLYKGVKNVDINAEVTADLIGDYLFTDSDFINSLSIEKPNVFKKIYEEIKYLYKVATAGSKEARELEKVKRAFDKAYREGEVSKNNELQLSLINKNITDKVDIPYTVVSAYHNVAVNDNAELAKLQKEVKGINRGTYENRATGYKADINATTISKIIQPTQAFNPWGAKYNYIENLNAAKHLVELFENAVYIDSKPAQKAKNVGKQIKEYHYFVAPIEMNNKDYRVLITAREKVNSNTLYVVKTEILPNKIRDASVVGQKPTNMIGASRTISIADLVNGVNIYDYITQQNKTYADADIKYLITESGDISNEDLTKKIQIAEARSKQSPLNQQSVSNESVPQISEKSSENVKYSLLDNTGRQLTKEQQEYFKDSKVRDENGSLKVVYHGTPNGNFSTFKDGTYFTDNKKYADRYQTPSASSISVGKVASNPKTFEFYLNMTKPFDINDAEAREVYINDYIKGGNAMGINPYLSDAEYAKINTIDWTEGEDLRDFLIDNGYDYDGLILDEGADGGYGNEVQYRGKSYVVFSPEQIKSIDNTNPTSDADIRFSLSDTVEETKDLIAIHNLQSSELAKTLEFGGFPMPSIAIIKAKQSHERYGDVSVIFGKDTIDPQFMKANKVYGGDAWTPTYPKIEYKANAKVAKKISDKYYELAEKIGYDEAKPLYRYANEIENELNRNDGEGGMLERIYNDTSMMQVFLQDSGRGKVPNVKTETDYEATKENIRSAAKDGYKEWVDGLFKGVEAKTGIRNNLSYYTNSGNPRSWDALHWENTLENVVKAMKEQDQTGADAFSPDSALFAVAQKKYGSIAEIKADSNRLGEVSENEYETLKDSYSKRLAEIANSIKDTSKRNSFIAMEEAAQLIVDAVRNYKTKSGMLNYMQKWNKQVTSGTVNDIASLVSDVANMPTGYFEAKPQRAVGLDEVGVFVIPNNADVKLKQELLNKGYSIAEYNPNVEGDRQRIVNQFEEYKFSLGDVGTQSKEYGNYVFGKDIALEQDIAPIREDIPTTKAAGLFAEDYAPITEAEANIRDAEQSDKQYFLDDIALVAEAPYYGESNTQTANVEDPFYDRDIKGVGKRNVKAYMCENPEVKPFFQEEAQNMLYELNNSVKGTRAYNDDLYYETNGEMGWFGTNRETSGDIAYLLDTFHYTYAQIEKGLKAIIEDNGAENNAVSKRIEFALNDRLKDGYTDFISGYKIPPNEDYVKLLADKQITTYSDESWDMWLRSMAQEDIAPMPESAAPIEDIGPVRQMESAPIEDIAPIAQQTAEAQETAETTEEKAPQKATRANLHQNIIDNIKKTFAQNGYSLEEVLKKAKNLSTFRTVDNTPQRVMEKALGYKEGQILSDLTVNKVAQNETEGIKWLNSYTDRKNGLLAQISKRYNIKPGSKESAAAQMYAEGFYVNDANEIIKYGDAQLAKDFPSPGVQANIVGLATDPRIRQIYDETLDMINASRARNLYPEIKKLDNYFLHFRAMEDTFSRLGLPFNPNDIKAKDLPTDLNGVTADLKPGQPYFASANHRKGMRTSFDLLGGLEKYLSSAKNQIYHIDDIQTLRALRNYIADDYGQAKGLENLDDMSEEEMQERISQVYDAHLSTFAKFLNEEANVLAGKTSLIDRGLEGVIGRRGITFLDTLNRQVGSNMVGFNVSSSLTNFISVAQAFAKTKKADFFKAFTQTVAHKLGRNDGFAENSSVMIRRKGADRFYRTPYQKVSDAGYVMMSAIDNVSTEIIARAKYNELTRKGMSSELAHYETDKWVCRLMGDRSLGQQPQLYNSKMLGLFTKFQLEVRNQLDSQFYDTIQEAKVSNEYIESERVRNAKTAAKVTSTLFQLAVAQHLFGKAFESVAGYNPAFDIIEVLIKTLGLDDEEDSEDTVLDNIEQGFLELVGDLPYTSLVTDGGRIPISAALPLGELVTGKDEYGNDKPRLKTLAEAAPYYILPGGYGQLKKTAQGLKMFDDDLPISGSYTDSGNLRFPVEDTPLNRLQAGVFGQWASANARDYFDNERQPLKEKQIEEYASLDMPIREYWDYRDGLKEQDTLEDKFEYVAGLDIPIAEKNILINNIVDRKEAVDMSNYDDFADYEEFDFYVKNTEKYNFLQDNNISYAEYTSSEDAKKEYDEIYSWVKNNPEKVTLSKAVTDDVIEYKRFTKELNNIKADKDEDGNSISGSAKEKKIEYINSLDLDYGQKIILFRSLYSSDEDRSTYNRDIVDYLNSRDDITYEEMKTILEELDFKVYEDGTIEW